MPKYVICQGCPASGKSTWTQGQIDNHGGGIRLNRDDMRRKLFNFGQWNEYKFTKARENSVTENLDKDLKDAAAAGLNVYDDNTNLNPKYLRSTENKAKELGYTVEYKTFFDVLLHKLIERNLYREFSVGEDVLHRMFEAQLKLQDRIIKPTKGLPYCVVVDVDGTVADMGKGEKWGRMPYDWDKVGNDKPKRNVINVVNRLEEAGEKIIFLTGRDGVALEETKRWINDRVFNSPDYDVFQDPGTGSQVEIFIRTPDDMRSDCDIKEELLREKILPRYNVRFILDDRKQVVDHWRCLGLECWQVSAGFF